VFGLQGQILRDPAANQGRDMIAVLRNPEFLEVEKWLMFSWRKRICTLATAG
jgi:hypothetical protein